MKTGDSPPLLALVLSALYATGYSFSVRNLLDSKQTGQRHKRSISAESIEEHRLAAKNGISRILSDSKRNLRGDESLYVSIVIDNSYHVKERELNIIRSILYQSFSDHDNDLIRGKIHVNIIGYSSQEQSREYLNFSYRVLGRSPGSRYIKRILERNIRYQENAVGGNLQDGIAVMFHATDRLKRETGKKMVILCSTGRFTDPPVINLDSTANQFKNIDGIELISLAVGADFHQGNLNRFSSGSDHQFKIRTKENSPLSYLFRRVLRAH